MKTNSKKTYATPEFVAYGSFEEITQQGGGEGIDGIIGVDIAGVTVPIGVTTGSM